MAMITVRVQPGEACFYLHLLVHLYVDDFDFIQLMSQSDQRVLEMKTKAVMCVWSLYRLSWVTHVSLEFKQAEIYFVCHNT